MGVVIEISAWQQHGARRKALWWLSHGLADLRNIRDLAEASWQCVFLVVLLDSGYSSHKSPEMDAVLMHGYLGGGKSGPQDN